MKVATKAHIDNIKAGILLSPLILLGYTLLVNTSRLEAPKDLVASSVVFMGSFLFANRFFQPDLDIYPNFPGHEAFPLGGASKSLHSFLTSILDLFMRRDWASTISYRLIFLTIAPLRIVWVLIWTPYSMLLTHRGIGHWPIIGYCLRISYLYGFILTFSKLLNILSFHLNFPHYLIPHKLEGLIFQLLPWNLEPSSLVGVMGLAFLISDQVHIVVDFIDSKRRNKKFCPREIPRGLLIRFFTRRKK